MAVSNDEQKIGVAMGRTLIKEEQQITEIVIYNKNRATGKYDLEKMRDFEFDDACIQFNFSVRDTADILFFTREEVFKFNYLDESKDRETVYKMRNQLDD